MFGVGLSGRKCASHSAFIRLQGRVGIGPKHVCPLFSEDVCQLDRFLNALKPRLAPGGLFSTCNFQTMYFLIDKIDNALAGCCFCS
jgi:hypothetical protein